MHRHHSYSMFAPELTHVAYLMHAYSRHAAQYLTIVWVRMSRFQYHWEVWLVFRHTKSLLISSHGRTYIDGKRLNCFPYLLRIWCIPNGAN
jgi:hypothetical protein